MITTGAKISLLNDESVWTVYKNTSDEKDHPYDFIASRELRLKNSDIFMSGCRWFKFEDENVTWKFIK